MTAEPLPVAPEESGRGYPRGYERLRARGGLALVPPPVRARRAPFVALVIALLVGGLVGLLLLNTASAQDAFKLHSLQSQAATLERQKEAYTSAGDGLDDPARLAMRAAKLGLVPGGAPIFLTNGQALPKGAVRLGDLAYVPAPVIIPPPVTIPTPAASLPVTAKKPAKKPVKAATTKKPGNRTAAKLPPVRSTAPAGSTVPTRSTAPTAPTGTVATKPTTTKAKTTTPTTTTRTPVTQPPATATKPTSTAPTGGG